jgi:enterochelin esterase-like enzyme
MADADAFNKKVHLVWLGIGTAEGERFYNSVKGYCDSLEKAGIKTVFYESPGTAHEWLTWRRCLKEFAPRLFQEAASQSADVSGQWQGEIDTQIGLQKYLFTFKIDDGKLSGKTNAEIGDHKHEVELKECKIAGDTISFVEEFDFQDNELRVEYKGKIGQDEIKFTRQVGDVANEDFVAKRIKVAPPKTSATPRDPAAGGPRGFGGPIVLGPDDKPAFADPPQGFNVKREDIARGKMEMIEYDSKTVGTRRKMLVYTPPGYTADKKYPVLYLLHGIGGDETEWQRFTSPDIILDNLLADGKVVSMIVVMPNGRAQLNDRAEGDVFRSAKAFEDFEQDLLKDVIPAIEARYSVQADREHRALAGLSMGGGQSLNFGLGHLDTFAWVGGFSSAPNTKQPAQLVGDPAAATRQIKLLWISCGNKDGLITISQGVHNYLKEKNVPHVWHVDSNAHDPQEWRNNLYLFSQRIFH